MQIYAQTDVRELDAKSSGMSQPLLVVALLLAGDHGSKRRRRNADLGTPRTRGLMEEN